MTNRRKHLPIMATVIGLALAGCGERWRRRSNYLRDG